MKAPKAPVAPDPVATANAQTASNVATATANQAMNFVDQVGPDGSLKYSQVDTVTIPNGLGGTISVPRYLATTELSESGKALKGVNDQTEMNLATIGRDQSAKIGELLGTNVNLSNDAVEGRLMELGSKRLDPQFARDEEATRTQLANAGIQQGSPAWLAEMGRLDQAKNDARNQLLLSGRGQSVQEILTERNQPLNEISALLNGAQVSQPSFINTPQTTMGGTDYAGIVNSNYQGQMQAYQQKVASQNAMMGGLFGLAGTIGTAGIKYSDERLKTDIERIGTLDNGLPVYSYRMKGSDTPEIGVMARDVKRSNPAAVIRMPSGFDAVDYDRAVH